MSSRTLIHVLCHVLILVPAVGIPLALLPYKEDGGQPDFHNVPRIIYTLLHVAAFYFNVYYLYPRYFGRRRIMAYLMAIVGVCLVSILVYITTALLFAPQPLSLPHLLSQAVVKFFVSAMIIATGTCYCFIMEVIKAQRMEQEQLRTELSFLRSQVSPHFMFNTLNSMVALARKRSDKLEPALIELSNLMHYMLYESDQEKVSLTREIDYLQSYIDLQTLRFGGQVRILFSKETPAEDRDIEPMLLIPLIENAFKHGIGLISNPEINIHLAVDGDRLSLTVRNKYNQHSTEVKDKVAGIGLTNLVRRLKLLYPNRHEFMTEQNGTWYNASLKIQLHDQVSRSGRRNAVA